MGSRKKNRDKLKRKAVKAPAPKPGTGAIASDQETITAEYHRLQEIIHSVNKTTKKLRNEIAERENTISQVTNQGLQVIGEIKFARRMLEGFGVDVDALDEAGRKRLANGPEVLPGPTPAKPEEETPETPLEGPEGEEIDDEGLDEGEINDEDDDLDEDDLEDDEIDDEDFDDEDFDDEDKEEEEPLPPPTPISKGRRRKKK